MSRIANSTIDRRTPMPKGQRQGFNSTLAPSRKPLKQRRHRKCYAHLRDPAYRKWVRGRGCQLAGKPSHVCKGVVEFAHLANEGQGAPDRGNGIGLCGLSGHREGAKSWHVLGKQSFPRYWRFDPWALARALEAKYVLRDFGPRNG